MTTVPEYFGQIGFPNPAGREREFWTRLIASTQLQRATQAKWYEPILGDGEFVLIKSPPNLMANVLGKNGDGVGVVRLCWLPSDGPGEIRFQGSGDAFRECISQIRILVDGTLTEGQPTDEK